MWTSGTAALAALLLAAAPPQDPCAAARTPVPAAAKPAMDEAAVEVETYRAAWRAACDPSGEAADLATLLDDAEALVADARLGRVVAATARAIPPGAAWPLPGLRRAGDAVALDWASFAAAVDRGTAEDRRFFRGLARTTADGEPVWLGTPPAAGREPCLRLAETSWTEVATGIEEMERGQTAQYARRGAALRELALETLAALAKGGSFCGCVRGDPLAALDALVVAAGPERLGTPGRRALVRSAGEAADALRSGRARVSWLRESPGAPPTGCDAPR